MTSSTEIALKKKRFTLQTRVTTSLVSFFFHTFGLFICNLMVSKKKRITRLVVKLLEVLGLGLGESAHPASRQERLKAHRLVDYLSLSRKYQRRL